MSKRTQYFLDGRQKRAIFDGDDGVRSVQKRLCERNFHKASFCRDVLFTIAGANPDNFDLVRDRASRSFSPFIRHSALALFFACFALVKTARQFCPVCETAGPSGLISAENFPDSDKLPTVRFRNG